MGSVRAQRAVVALGDHGAPRGGYDGAAELRDEITDAWRQSIDVTVGYPLVTVRDAEAGKVRIVPKTFGAD